MGMFDKKGAPAPGLKVAEDAEIKLVQVEQIDPNEFNPNEMTDNQLSLLGGAMEENGHLLDVLQVWQKPDGRYMILGGEHRWKAAKGLGWEKVPAMVLTGEKWADPDRQRSTTVKLNVLRGKLSPEKFFKLWNEMSQRHRDEALAGMMGFARQDEMVKLVSKYRRKLEQAGLPKDQTEAFAKKARKAKTLEELQAILEHFATKAPRTVERSYVMFTMSGREHLSVMCDEQTWKAVREMMDAAAGKKLDANEVFSQLVSGWKNLGCFGPS